MTKLARQRRRPLRTAVAALLAALLVLPLALAARADGYVHRTDSWTGEIERNSFLEAEESVEFRLSAAASGGLYVALGDSVATVNRPTYVEKLLPDYQSTLGVTELSNRARPAENSGTLRTNGQLDLALSDINGASDTRVVTIDIGGNDALLGCDFTSPGCAFRANFSATLADLQAALANDPGAEPLIAFAYYNPDVGEPTEAMRDLQVLGASVRLDCADSGAELGLNDIIAQEADAHGALLADAYPAFKVGGQAFMADDVHPSEAGDAAIVEAFRNAAQPCAAPAPPPDETPPPEEAPPPDGTPSLPSNGFRFGALKRSLDTGTAKLTVKVPGAGELLLKKTKRVRRDSDQAAEAGKVRLKIRPRAKATAKLADVGKVKVSARVRYTPTGGDPNTKSTRVKLKRR